MADTTPITPHDFAKLGNSLLAAKDRMRQVSPEAWAQVMNDPKLVSQMMLPVEVAEEFETTRSKLTHDFLFPLIKAATKDQGYLLSTFIHQMTLGGMGEEASEGGLSEDDFVSILVTALEFDRANALFKMQIVRDVSPPGMFWSANIDPHKDLVKTFESRSPYVAQHRPSINKCYVSLFETVSKFAMNTFDEKIRTAMAPLLEFKAPQWILDLE